MAGPGAGSLLIAIQGTGTSGSTARECEVQTAFSVASPAKSFCVGANSTGVVRIHLVVINATAGTVPLQANNSGGTNTVTLKANSDLVGAKDVAADARRLTRPRSKYGASSRGLLRVLKASSDLVPKVGKPRVQNSRQ